MSGNFVLAMTRLKMEFIGRLAGLAVKDGNEKARKWADWYKQKPNFRPQSTMRSKSYSDQRIYAG